MLASVLTFRRIKTTINPLTPEATTMVTSGIYRFTRNPMYLGFILILAGWAIDLSNLPAFAFLPLFMWYMNRFQILPEERALTSKFSEPLYTVQGFSSPMVVIAQFSASLRMIAPEKR